MMIRIVCRSCMGGGTYSSDHYGIQACRHCDGVGWMTCDADALPGSAELWTSWRERLLLEALAPDQRAIYLDETQWLRDNERSLNIVTEAVE